MQISVADPDTLKPDPVFQVNPDTDPRVSWPKIEGEKIAIYSSLGPPKDVQATGEAFRKENM